MGTTKRLNFDIETNAIAEICKALGHPTRMHIMTILWKQNHITCGEIVEQIPLAQSTISKHLSELKKANLLHIKNEGKKTIYSIEIDKILLLRKYFTTYLSSKTLSSQKEKEIIQAISTPKAKTENKERLKEYNYQFPNKNKQLE